MTRTPGSDLGGIVQRQRGRGVIAGRGATNRRPINEPGAWEGLRTHSHVRSRLRASWWENKGRDELLVGYHIDPSESSSSYDHFAMSPLPWLQTRLGEREPV
ncbi:hypothetical protein SODALDRAFT_331841 [Sodiomyces alkalinus F11]|uniref:Uncharacterized protein n=1 Tax=Sodiomyces alkalinus (strain CBS 110278 / VKM F-3762 / F11) TaxID=1314773 RepID=A0A3N2PZ13_SODAK|nr:hypothetical protein SODALDRAFT_331841 [Sodiomyces alkalinus F11]ROT39732.1 hypothetical protein SODALDRAFT_331841 [Sodiomyces alkalinus F11]